MSASDFAPLNIPPSEIHLGGEVDPADWRAFSPDQQRILRGMFAGRVIRVSGEKVIQGRVVPSWLDLFDTIEEAQAVLGREITNTVLMLTVDHVNVRLAGVGARSTVKTATGYETFGKVETLLRQMPARFTWADLMAARDGSTSSVGRMARRSIAITIYLHVVAGNIEYIPNRVDKNNPTLRKLTTYLSPRAL